MHSGQPPHVFPCDPRRRGFDARIELPVFAPHAFVQDEVEIFLSDTCHLVLVLLSKPGQALVAATRKLGLQQSVFDRQVQLDDAADVHDLARDAGQNRRVLAFEFIDVYK